MIHVQAGLEVGKTRRCRRPGQPGLYTKAQKPHIPAKMGLAFSLEAQPGKSKNEIKTIILIGNKYSDVFKYPENYYIA